jgi:hypothetical protein
VFKAGKWNRFVMPETCDYDARSEIVCGSYPCFT